MFSFFLRSTDNPTAIVAERHLRTAYEDVSCYGNLWGRAALPVNALRGRSNIFR
jgi:hypothetical protein